MQPNTLPRGSGGNKPMAHKTLITGGCGFVGANLISHLTQQGGFEITVLDNESLGSYSTIEPFQPEFVRGDIRDRELLDQVVAGKDSIVHLAADTRVIESIENPEHNFDVNVVGTFGLLMAARNAGVPRVINASTGGAILGDVPPPVDETMAPAPTSPYGASKLAVEGYCSAFGASFGVNAASLRFSNVYGPLSVHKGSVVAAFYRQILQGETLTVYGDGTQTRDYVFSQDLVSGIRLAMQSDKTGAFQLGTGTPTSINELIAAMREVVGSDYEVTVDYEDFRAGEIRNTWCNITKASDELGYSATTTLLDGLTQTWDWFLAR